MESSKEQKFEEEMTGREFLNIEICETLSKFIVEEMLDGKEVILNTLEKESHIDSRDATTKFENLEEKELKRKNILEFLLKNFDVGKLMRFYTYDGQNITIESKSAN